jgi:uncharacterized sporulation protein YeaH/YhbH (DUF444 family)
VFVAHTTEAWEFNEPDFFKVTGTGGTVASVGLLKVQEIMDQRFDPGSCNVYLFYASDGDNASDDRTAAGPALESIAEAARHSGYVEISTGVRSSLSEISALFQSAMDEGLACSRCSITGPDDVAPAVRHFFSAEAQAQAGDEAAGAGA